MENMEKRITIRIEDELNDSLSEWAEKVSKSRSRVVRQILKNYRKLGFNPQDFDKVQSIPK